MQLSFFVLFVLSYIGWLDGIYMGDMFYGQYTHDLDSNNLTAWGKPYHCLLTCSTCKLYLIDDIALQFNVMFAHTIQNATAPNNTGLLYHGYDYSKKAIWASPDRGHSPEVWDRALGWYFMSLVDILTIFPEWHPGYSSFLEILQRLAPKLRDAADAQTGVWWLVMTQPGRTGNYFESSGSSMFVYALLKAVRLGYVQDPDGSIVAAATKAYQYMVCFHRIHLTIWLDLMEKPRIDKQLGCGQPQWYV
jgi:rhamnogalacturonyl hydrolase YesR